MSQLPRLFIRGLSTISPLGATRTEIRSALNVNLPRFSVMEDESPAFVLSHDVDGVLEGLTTDSRFKKLDRVALLALAAARGCFAELCGELRGICGVSIGSARGPTESLERAITAFAHDPLTPIPTETSPSTTAGNISAWVGQLFLDHLKESSADAASNLMYLGTSMTCSSAFQSLIAGLGLVRGGFGSGWVFGGAEACLTPFTIAQLRALRLYSRGDARFPCRPCQDGTARENSVVLGEAAGVAVLALDDTGLTEADFELVGVGWATERIPSATGISPDGRVFEAAMRRALASDEVRRRVCGVLLHAPGSVNGDKAERAAVARVFGEEGVPVWSTKHLTGHSYGASGMVSLAVAREALNGTRLLSPDYPNGFGDIRACRSNEVLLINTAGFGGSAVSLAVTRATG